MRMGRWGSAASLMAWEARSQAAALARSSRAEGLGGGADEGARRRCRCEAFGDFGATAAGPPDGPARREGAAGHVGGGDEDDGFEPGVFGVLGGDDGGDHAAHGVSGEDEGAGVGAEFGRVGRDAEIGDGSVDVFDGVGEGEAAGRAPGAAVVEEEDVVTGATEGLRDIEIFFVAGEAVEEDDDGMRACSGGDVDDGVDEGAVAGELEGFDEGGMGFVGGGVCRDGVLGWALGGEGERCGEDSGEGDELGEAHS